MPEGGRLRLATRVVSGVDAASGTSAPERESVGTGAAYVEIQVVDQGDGIPPEHLSKISDPLFTTKETGTGLGLSVVYGIMEKHDGRIVVDSRAGEGTTMTLRLPARVADRD